MNIPVIQKPNSSSMFVGRKVLGKLRTFFTRRADSKLEHQETRLETPITRRSVHMVDASTSISSTSSVQSLVQFLPLPPAGIPSRSTSSASSSNSYLSSHHSDDDLFIEPINALSSPLLTFSGDVGSTVHSPTFPGSSPEYVVSRRKTI